MAAERDALDKTVTYLQKREGIDKTLKIIRYASRLLVAVTAPGSEVQTRFSALEKSIGTSRKAYRLGKFLQHVNTLRRTQLSNKLSLLEVVATAGDGLYYFLDQYNWLIKAGFVSKAYEARLSKVTAWSELAGYSAAVALNLMRIWALHQRELALVAQLRRKQQEEHETDLELLKEAQMLRSVRLLRTALVVQDCADALLALHDITGGRNGIFSHQAVLALAGLVSAAVSSYKNWNT